MVWYGQPLMALILLAALQTIPHELYEAAERRRRRARGSSFRYITLPHLLPIDPVPRAAAHDLDVEPHRHDLRDDAAAGRASRNYTEAVYSFMLTNQFEIGYASAVAVVLAILLVAASALYVRHLARTVLVVGMTTHAPTARPRAIWIASAPPRSSSTRSRRSCWILIASITPELKADAIAPWLSNRARHLLPERRRRCDNYVDLFGNVPFALYFRNSTIIATGNMLLTLAGREPRRLRFRALPLRRPQLAADRDAGGLHDPERRAAGAAAGDLPHLRPHQHASRA